MTDTCETLGWDSHIGRDLRDRRKAMGVSLASASKDLRIGLAYLTAIEQLDKDVLPGAGYAVGFVRSYATYLGLDCVEAVSRYKTESEIPRDLGMRTSPHFVQRREIRLPRGSFAAALITTTFATLAVWYGTSTTAQSPAMDMNYTANLMATPQPAAKITLDPGIITLEATRTSWIEILSADGGVVARKILVPGENFEVTRQAGLVLNARDGSAITVHRAGQASGPLASKGDPLSAYPLP
ncbi:helix-turn-helix domain-containing protein [Robiginitomaculum antarcticum]|uniref:helix-turn-helix domain-containing protein n=1 Tax=Robiginitomaculum antarcticum TaxID=437507 RepID=UPI0003773701|nr:helix-turn-helix domain-containing protein [Robiginitomaculum antarcticum]